MKHIVMIMFLIFTVTSTAQKYNTKMQGCVEEGKVDLRWAPADYKTWQAGIKNGYIVERFTIMRDDEILSKEDIAVNHKVFYGAFKPAPLEDWEAYSNDKYVAIAAECIYGENIGVAAATPHVAYQIHKQQQQKFSFAQYAADMSSDAAWLSGLAYSDKTVLKNEKYLYKVYVNDSIAQDTALVFLDASVVTPLYTIPKPVIKWGNRIADISFDLSVIKGAYTCYNIERSGDGGKNFTPLSETPNITISSGSDISTMFYKRDSLPDNNTSFIYRVYGIDCFGRKSNPTYSDKGQGVLPLTGTPHITRCETVENNRVEIEWEFPDSLNNSVVGFRIFKQSGPKSRFRKIFGGTDSMQREYVDKMPGITNYYKISVYNNERENLMPTVSYASLIDSFPPAAPVVLNGKIDTLGIATIKWKANVETDLAGYRVYMANQKNDTEYSLVTSKLITDTVFSHKVALNTLTHEVFYHVRAVDKRDNHSAPSQTLVLMRPDTIRPVMPVLRRIDEKRGYPSLHWLCSSSEDVASHYLLRKMPRAEKYDTVAVFSDRQQTFIDKQASPGYDYIYAVMAKDASGNRSKLSSMYYHTNVTVTDKVKIKCQNKTDGTLVSWSVESGQNILEYVILRAANDEDLHIISRTTESAYFDKDVQYGNRYVYAIKIIYSDGTESGVYK